jgi:nucleotide-binding universal stress UspA family protein
VEDRSTPAGLRALAERLGADVVVFCSDSHTAAGTVSIGNSARRLLEGGPVAVAIAPAGLSDSGGDFFGRVAAVGDGADASASGTAQGLADALGGSVVPADDADVELLVVGSRPEAKEGTLALTAAAENLVEGARCSVLMVPRGRALTFPRHAAVGA